LFTRRSLGEGGLPAIALAKAAAKVAMFSLTQYHAEFLKFQEIRFLQQQFIQ